VSRYRQVLPELFLDFSKDRLEVQLTNRLGHGGTGTKHFHSKPQIFLDALEDLDFPDGMTATVNTQTLWSNLLKERLHSGLGSTIQGYKRGRGVEGFAENIIKEVFGKAYKARCTFQGMHSTAKCDFAIPDQLSPLILIEAKSYGATVWKIDNIIGDVNTIIRVKRHNTSLLMLTDGLTWQACANDLRKLIQRQNEGRIIRIYTK